jgi:hypothetical protein
VVRFYDCGRQQGRQCHIRRRCHMVRTSEFSVLCAAKHPGMVAPSSCCAVPAGASSSGETPTSKWILFARAEICRITLVTLSRRSIEPQRDLVAITETNRMHLVLFGIQNRTLGPYLAEPLIGSLFQYWCSCSHAFAGTIAGTGPVTPLAC